MQIEGNAFNWAWREVKREEENDGRWSLLVEFTRITGEVSNTTFMFASNQQINDEGNERCHLKAWNKEASYSPLNQFDIGEDSVELLKMLINFVRDYPLTSSLENTADLMDTQYPDSLFRSERLIMRMRLALEDTYGYIPTWEEWKAYVQANIFELIDEYPGYSVK
jgi:hypothetical protein